MKKRNIVILGIFGFLLIIFFLMCENLDSELYFAGIDKSREIDLYKSDNRFRKFQQITDDGIRIDEIAVHSDGNTILLLRRDGYNQKIVKYSIVQKEFVEVLSTDNILLDGQRIAFLDWDVSGDKIIIVIVQGIDFQSYFDFKVLTIDLSSNEISSVFTANQDYFYYRRPMYSYNGKDEIVFDIDGKIYLVTISTGEIEFIANGYKPFWTPDGSRVSYFEDCGSYRFNIYNINIESGEKEYINEGFFYIFSEGGLSWSKDEKYIYYIEARGESDPMSVVKFNVANGKSHKYLQSNKSYVNVSPVFITNIYDQIY